MALWHNMGSTWMGLHERGLSLIEGHPPGTAAWGHHPQREEGIRGRPRVLVVLLGASGAACGSESAEGLLKVSHSHSIVLSMTGR